MDVTVTGSAPASALRRGVRTGSEKRDTRFRGTGRVRRSRGGGGVGRKGPFSASTCLRRPAKATAPGTAPAPALSDRGSGLVMGLIIQQRALEAAGGLRQLMPIVCKRDKALFDQMHRAMTSVVLNIAEADGNDAGTARAQFASACGAAERDTGMGRTARLAKVAGWTCGLGPRKPRLGARVQSEGVARMPIGTRYVAPSPHRVPPRLSVREARCPRHQVMAQTVSSRCTRWAAVLISR